MAKRVESPQSKQTPAASAAQEQQEAAAATPASVFPPELPVLREGAWELTPEFAAAAQLTGEEALKLTALIGSNIEKLNALEMEHLEIERESGQDALFVIRAFPEQAHQLKNELKAGVESILSGKETAAVRLWNEMRLRGEIERAGFGMQTARVNVSLPEHGDGQYVFTEVHYIVEHPLVQQHDRRPSGSEAFASEMVAKEVLLRFRHLLEAGAK